MMVDLKVPDYQRISVLRTIGILAVFVQLLLHSRTLVADEYVDVVRPLVQRFCIECHSGDDPSGDANFDAMQNTADARASFQQWQKAIELLQSRAMPPDDEPQPTDAERAVILNWYQSELVDSVVAQPGTFRARRLSATEYRNTLRSLFGFDLEVAIVEAEQTRVEKSLVMKLLPSDPPGKSGFKNDTHGNPLTTTIWEQYSYLADTALNELFSPQREAQLSALAGEFDQEFSPTNIRTMVNRFLPRAFRRDVPSKQLTSIADAIVSDPDRLTATKRELKVALMSPQFIYRGLLMNSTGGQQQAVDDFELAERLSYFLWADMPDEELFAKAASGELSAPETLADQVQRMLASPKSRSLADDFAVQWLGLDEIEHRFDNPPQADAFKSQPIDFVHYLFTENRPLMEIIDSSVAFVSPLTRKYYPVDNRQMVAYKKAKGIEVEAVPNQMIHLSKVKERGGLLTMPGLLAMNRGPVLRGTWILERILGEHLPDPPADVGVVKPNRRGQQLSFRERFQEHRANESCAICHDKIDPLGFALQRYDANGTFIDEKYEPKKKKQAEVEPLDQIDTSGTLPSGESFANFDELKQILATSQRTRVIRNLVERTLSYALCRQLEIFDQPTVNQITSRLVKSNGTYQDLIHEIVNSLPFRETFVPGESS